MNPFSFITGLFEPATKLLDNLHANATEKLTIQEKMLEIQNTVTMKVIEYEKTLIESQATIIQTEAKSESFLARNWRPVVMLVFTGLIVARWCGWTAPNLSEAEAQKLWDIIQFGLGGYVVGRSVEKIAPSIISAIKDKK